MRNDIIYKIQDYTHLQWNDFSRSSLGTPGCFLKTFEHDHARRIYYKLSNYDSYRGVFGHENVNELVASRLLDLLGINHVVYRLIHAEVIVDNKRMVTWISSTRNFKKIDEQKTALDTFYDLTKESNESPEDFCSRMGWNQYLYEMMLIDFLICNRDRHGANIEVLQKKDGSVRLAPLFDHGLSLLFSCYSDEERIKHFDVLKDRPVNNYLYTKSLQENLKFIPPDFKSPSLKIEDKKYLLRGLNRVISETHAEKIWEMIWERWQFYENLRNH